jgi:hypothetical protein
MNCWRLLFSFVLSLCGVCALGEVRCHFVVIVLNDAAQVDGFTGALCSPARRSPELPTSGMERRMKVVAGPINGIDYTVRETRLVFR